VGDQLACDKSRRCDRFADLVRMFPLPDRDVLPVHFRWHAARPCPSSAIGLATRSSFGGSPDGCVFCIDRLCLTILPAGRASVLAFSTPIWVVPLAGWWLHEYASRRAVFGVGLGLVGVLSVAAPSIYLNGMEHALAYFMLLAAAGAWAVTIVIVRAHRFTATVLALAPWQMLVAAGLLLPLAIVAEGAPPAIGVRAAVSLAYVGPIATAFAYWAVVEAGRHIRASTMAMALLAAPTLGILISALALDEPIGASLVAGVLLIGMGIRLVTHALARQADMSQPCNCSNTTEASADAP